MTGNELKAKRKDLGYSQQGLAAALDVALSSVARWEQLGDNEIPNSRMLELALESLSRSSRRGK